jgi:serine/threonine protein kinase
LAPPELTVGQVIGDRNTVQGPLGRGERVSAWEGVTTTGRPVVIKVYDPALGEASLSALRAAAAVTRDLPRGYALEVLDVGVDAGTGAAYVVTERSARPSLAHLVQLCPLQPEEVVALVRSLARALGGAHERGLPHLGLKPTNVFVGAPPACEVQLADFGATVARAMTGGAVDPECAPWLSPEQAFGGLPPGVGSDVFSTALVVFFALTGRSYWRSFGPRSDVAVWAREIYAPRARASERAGELGASLPEAWDVPFERALDVDPARRPGSIAELAESFARAARGEPALDPPAVQLPRFEVPAVGAPAPQVATSPGPRRRRAAWIAGGVAATILLGAGVLVAARMPKSSSTVPVATPQVAPSVPPPATQDSTPPPPASATAPATAAATPAPSASGAPAASSASPADPTMSTLVVTCNPPCDSIWVDGHLAPDATSGKALPPGVHMVAANLAHHVSKTQAVLCKRGEVTRIDVTFAR